MKWKSNLPTADLESDETKIISIGKPFDEAAEGNKIYFYDEVTRDSVLNLNKQIDSVTKAMKTFQFTYNLSEPPPVEIHICSEGGDALSCMSSIDKILSNPIPIHTYVEGFAASAATLLSVAGHKRFITPSSSMLIHQISSGLWGTYSQFKDEMKNIELIMNIIRRLYLTRTKFKVKDLEKLLTHDLFLSSDECLKIGLVDSIK